MQNVVVKGRLDMQLEMRKLNKVSCDRQMDSLPLVPTGKSDRLGKKPWVDNQEENAFTTRLWQRKTERGALKVLANLPDISSMGYMGKGTGHSGSGEHREDGKVGG